MPAGDPELAREMRLAARENLAAALLLLERGFLRAAASRFYFSMFQAVVFALERRGEKPPGGRDPYWSHNLVERRARSVRGSQADTLLFDSLRDMRIRADYLQEKVERRDLDRVKHDVRRFVEEAAA